MTAAPNPIIGAERRRQRGSARERGLEWLSASVMLLWGVVLGRPGDTLAAPNFTEFLLHGLTEENLGYLFAAIGMGRLAVLLINGRWPRTPIARMIGSGAGAIMWLQIAGLFGVSWWWYGIAGTGFAVYGCLAVAEFFSIYWAAVDVRYQRS